jgi:2-polyprenyl-3-methyl-5-hydroxy-6-metoxy-1,4-benzoquinol methylase
VSAVSIDALRESLTQPAVSPDYAAKMLHAIPEATVVDRATFLLERVKGKRVLEFGASGPMHEAIIKASTIYVGVDRETDGICVTGFDLDDVEQQTLPGYGVFDVIVCGEVIEHLSNPGHFLARLKRQYAGVPVIITVPNAFSEIGRKQLARGVENVNRDHVAWYSYRTLRTLLERVGYEIREFYWYNGEPRTAEGLIVVAE